MQKQEAVTAQIAQAIGQQVITITSLQIDLAEAHQRIAELEEKIKLDELSRTTTAS